MTLENPKNPRSPDDAQFRTVIQLMQLKRHEQPDAGFDARNAAAIRTRIAAGPERVSWGQRLWGLFEQTPSPALRYSMVTALVALVGLNVLTLTLQPDQATLPAVTNDAPALAQTAAEPMQLAQTNLAPETYAKPVFVFEYPASNRSPRGGLSIGPGPTVPVRYDF